MLLNQWFRSWSTGNCIGKPEGALSGGWVWEVLHSKRKSAWKYTLKKHMMTIMLACRALASGGLRNLSSLHPGQLLPESIGGCHYGTN